MPRRTPRTWVLPLTTAILLGSAGSAYAIPNGGGNQPPPPPPNQAPTAALTVTPNPGLVSDLPVVVATQAKLVGPIGDVLGRNAITFDASGSSDPDGSIVTYLWDLDGNGSFEKSTTTPRVSRSYSAPGDFAVKVRVVDNANAARTRAPP